MILLAEFFDSESRPEILHAELAFPTRGKEFCTQNCPFPTRDKEFCTQNSAFSTRDKEFCTQNCSSPTRDKKFCTQNWSFRVAAKNSACRMLFCDFLLGNFDPALLVELEIAHEELGATAVGLLVAVRDEDGAATTEVIDRTMADAEEILVWSEQECAAAEGHVATLTIEVRACDYARTAIDGLIGGVFASAAIVEADEEVIVAIVAEDEGGLDGIVTCLDDVVALLGEFDLLALHLMVEATGDGEWLGQWCAEIFGRERYDLDAVPEGAVGEVGLLLAVEDEVRIDGVPVVLADV